jgi:hypothetical protein
MIDGIKIYYNLADFEKWKQSVNIEFGRTILDTGEIKSKVRNLNGLHQRTFEHRATFQTYSLLVREVERKDFKGNEVKDYFLTIDGSLHKNYFDGENYSRFDWDKLQTEILNIENSLQLSPDSAKIVNIEFGVNIQLPFEVMPFLKRSLISYKGKPFNQYRPDRNGFVLGYVCDRSQYSVKIYDKGKQYNLPMPLMRFEKRFTKMQKLKEYGIKTLSDLKDRDKVKNLFALLQTAWNDVLLFDDSINIKRSNLRPLERELLNQGSNSKFWEELKETNRRRFDSKRKQFRELVKKYGQNLHGVIDALIKNEWETLFENCTNLPSVQSVELNKFTVKVKGKNVHTLPLHKTCISCGRDITNQKGNSKFCSAKYVGESAAHKCRNTNSNARNSLKNKIKRINGRGVLFDISPYLFVNNNKKQRYAI